MTLSGRSATLVVAALALSLAANFAWLGFLASRTVTPKRTEISAERIVSIGARALPAPLRTEIAQSLAPRRDEVREALRQVREARRQVLLAMRAEPFDPQALDAAFADLRRRLDTLSAIGEAAIAEAMAGASPGLRAEIAVPPEGR
ncbi:MAG: periplasmic heavy metal sensor [Rhizobiales bacterium]|nr:periplasmic heavy metal sensor [Hyphomicrobiales bacterium]